MNNDTGKLGFMFKRISIILLLLFIFILPSNAAFDIGEICYTINPLIVRNALPEANSHSRVSATLPEKTTVEIVYSVSNDIGEWYQIKWYSDVNKTYKTAWVEYPVLAVNISDIPDAQRKAAADIIKEAIMANFDFDTLDYYKQHQKYDEAIEMLNKRLYNLFIILDFSAKAHNSTSENDKKLNKSVMDIIGSTFGLRAAVYIFKEKYNFALSDFDEAIFYKDNDYTLYSAKATILFEQGYYSKAKNVFLKARGLAAKAGNEKKVIEIDRYISRINYELKKIK